MSAGDFFVWSLAVFLAIMMGILVIASIGALRSSLAADESLQQRRKIKELESKLADQRDTFKK